MSAISPLKLQTPRLNESDGAGVELTRRVQRASGTVPAAGARVETLAPALLRSLRAAFGAPAIERSLAPFAAAPLNLSRPEVDLAEYAFTVPEIRAIAAADGIALEDLVQWLGLLGVAADDVRRGVFLALGAGILTVSGWLRDPALARAFADPPGASAAAGGSPPRTA